MFKDDLLNGSQLKIITNIAEPDLLHSEDSNHSVEGFHKDVRSYWGNGNLMTVPEVCRKNFL